MNSHGNDGNILDLILSNDPLSVSFDNLSCCESCVVHELYYLCNRAPI